MVKSKLNTYFNNQPGSLVLQYSVGPSCQTSLGYWRGRAQGCDIILLQTMQTTEPVSMLSARPPTHEIAFLWDLMQSMHKQLELIREVDLCIAASSEWVRHTTPCMSSQGWPFPQMRHPLATRHPSLTGYCFNCYSDGICMNRSCIFKRWCQHAMVSMQFNRTPIEIPHHITPPYSLFSQESKLTTPVYTAQLWQLL